MTDGLLNTLLQDGTVLQVPSGFSMWPMLKDKQDVMLIRKIDKELHINDVILFQRSTGQLVLHRIVNKRGDIYTVRGDNCDRSEKVVNTQIFGILSGFFKKGRYIDCQDDKKYHIYVWFCRKTHYIRIPLRFAYRHIKKFFARIVIND